MRTLITSLNLADTMSAQGYISSKLIVPWYDYVLNNKHIKAKKLTLDDSRQYGKIKINPALNSDLSFDLSKKVSIFRGDITKIEVDAIVNAINSFFRHDGGVDSAIHSAAGPGLQEECRALGVCPTGSAKITGAHNLRAKYVIHTAAPQDGSPSKLESCYQKCFSFQKEFGIRSFAFPCIGTGHYRFPNRLAAHIALSATRKFLETADDIDRIIFCCYAPINMDIYETLMLMYFPVSV